MFAKINGRDFEFTANETILDVARRNDIHIPTLCELHDIDHAPGTCRVCLVEVRAGDTAAATDHMRAAASGDWPAPLARRLLAPEARSTLPVFDDRDSL